MSASTSFKQDMPPEGGYKRILFARNPAKTYFNGKYCGCVNKINYTIFLIWNPIGYQCIAGYIGITAASIYVYYLTHKEIKRNEIEMRSGRHALLPLLLAERDREYLKQIRINRDEEEKLMANVEGWKVGYI